MTKWVRVTNLGSSKAGAVMAPLTTTAFTRRSRRGSSRSGPRGSRQPLPKPRCPSMTTISQSRISAQVLQVRRRRARCRRHRSTAGLGGGDAILADEHRGLRAPRQQQRLVAHLGGPAVHGDARDAARAAAITARHDGHAHAHGRELHRQPGHQRRLAGAAHGEIADHHHRHLHAHAMPQPHAIQQAAQPP